MNIEKLVINYSDAAVSTGGNGRKNKGEIYEKEKEMDLRKCNRG